MNLRMYFFVPYNISEIQKGIQAGHCALEYILRYGHTTLCVDFVKKHKTWIILNGGTTMDYDEYNRTCGDINEIRDKLSDNEIAYAEFREPDLNNALTAVCFIADERVWDFETYPDWEEPEIDNIPVESSRADYESWVRSIGGDKNRILRDLIRGKRLA